MKRSLLPNTVLVIAGVASMATSYSSVWTVTAEASTELVIAADATEATLETRLDVSGPAIAEVFQDSYRASGDLSFAGEIVADDPSVSLEQITVEFSSSHDLVSAGLDTSELPERLRWYASVGWGKEIYCISRDACSETVSLVLTVPGGVALHSQVDMIAHLRGPDMPESDAPKEPTLLLFTGQAD